MSNFLKRSKHAWEELEYDRRHPRNEQEACFPNQEPLFPREILEPLYNEYIRLNPPYDKAIREISGFYVFLLKQSKP
jgi:hypothetical protein